MSIIRYNNRFLEFHKNVNRSTCYYFLKSQSLQEGNLLTFRYFLRSLTASYVLIIYILWISSYDKINSYFDITII